VNLIFVPDLSSLFAAKKASYEDLIIGGAKFPGRRLTNAALARNHKITLFNRGKHSAAICLRR
jgi:hypothetical protein